MTARLAPWEETFGSKRGYLLSYNRKETHFLHPARPTTRDHYAAVGCTRRAQIPHLAYVDSAQSMALSLAIFALYLSPPGISALISPAEIIDRRHYQRARRGEVLLMVEER